MYVKNIILKSKNESYIWEVLSSGAFNHDAEGVVLTFESVVEILKCYPNESYWAVLYIIYWTRWFAIHLLIFACELCLKVWSLKWKLLKRNFTVYYALPDGSSISGHETKIGEGCMQAPGPNQMTSKEWLSRSAGYHSFPSSKLVCSSPLHFHEKS